MPIVVVDPPERPPVKPASEDGAELWEILYAALGPFREEDEAGTGDLLRFCQAWCEPLQPVYEIVKETDGEAPWSVLFDVDNCPAGSLPYLAQFVGVVITPEMSDEQIRAEIREPTGWKRGQPEAVRVAARRGLTGEDPLVIIHPRTPEVGAHYVRTLLSETPNPARTEATIRAALPAWELLNYEAIEGVTVADVAASAKWTTVADLAAAFASVKDLAEVGPSEI